MRTMSERPRTKFPITVQDPRTRATEPAAVKTTQTSHTALVSAHLRPYEATEQCGIPRSARITAGRPAGSSAN